MIRKREKMFFFRNHGFGFFLLSAMAIMYRCSDNRLAGSVSETTNGGAVGAIVNQGGGAAPQTQVKLFPADYDPIKGTVTIPVDTTDSLGKYVFTRIGSGYYAIQAVHLCNRSRAFIGGIHIAGDTVPVPVATLLMPGAIKVMLPSGADPVHGYVYVPGTTIVIFLNGSSGFVMLDSVPAGTMPAIDYAATNSIAQKVIRYNISAVSGDTVTVANPEWKYSRALQLNTTPSGADVSGNLYNFPVLVRLTANNFNFAQSKAHGDDIRFTKSDNTSLPYEIERWDAVNHQAEIWVKIDTIFGNDSVHSIMMYWGNQSAIDSSSGAAVFDTANGFQGVWHLQETGTSSALDATRNHDDGTPSDAAPTPVAGPIGFARQFNGVSNYISMVGTANGKFNFPENGTYSLSAWVKVDPFPNQSGVIVSKQLYQYNLQLRNDNLWEFHVFDNTVGFESTASAATSGVWTLVEGVRSGTNQYLYVNGTLCASIAADTMPPGSPTMSRITSNDVCVGRLPVINNSGQSWRYFTGSIDEIRISNTAQSADWIKLCYMNQKTDNRLVSFK